MASSALICANDNEFNSTILGDDAFYFSTVDDVSEIITNVSHKDHNDKIKNNRIKIAELYTWEKIVEQYETLFANLLKR